MAWSAKVPASLNTHSKKKIPFLLSAWQVCQAGAVNERSAHATPTTLRTEAQTWARGACRGGRLTRASCWCTTPRRGASGTASASRVTTCARCGFRAPARRTTSRRCRRLTSRCCSRTCPRCLPPRAPAAPRAHRTTGCGTAAAASPRASSATRRCCTSARRAP